MVRSLPSLDLLRGFEAAARSAGLAPLEVGPLAMARHLEAMAHLNIQIAVGMQGGTRGAFIYHRAD